MEHLQASLLIMYDQGINGMEICLILIHFKQEV